MPSDVASLAQGQGQAQGGALQGGSAVPDDELVPVRVEHRADVEFLQDSIGKYISDFLPAFVAQEAAERDLSADDARNFDIVMRREMTRFVDLLFDLAGPNIVVNDMPYHVIMNESGPHVGDVEPLEQKISIEVDEMARTAYSLVDGVTDRRREVLRQTAVLGEDIAASTDARHNSRFAHYLTKNAMSKSSPRSIGKENENQKTNSQQDSTANGARASQPQASSVSRLVNSEGHGGDPLNDEMDIDTVDENKNTLDENDSAADSWSPSEADVAVEDHAFLRSIVAHLVKSGSDSGEPKRRQSGDAN